MHFVYVMPHYNAAYSYSKQSLGYSFVTLYIIDNHLWIQKNTHREKSKQEVKIVLMWLYWHLIWWCFGPYWHEWGFYVATVQYHPLDFSDRPLNYLSFSSDHLIYLGLLHWIYCLVFFQNWNVKSSVMYAVALCCESFTDPPKAASSWSLDRARNK